MAELWEEELDLGLGTKGAPCLSFPISPEEMCIAPQWKSAAMCALLQPPPDSALRPPWWPLVVPRVGESPSSAWGAMPIPRL